MIRNSIRLSRIIGKIKGDKLPEDFMGVHFNYKDVMHMVNYTSFRIEERIKAKQLMGLLESLQYISRDKYHREFGKEQTTGHRLPQNLKKDLFAEVKRSGGILKNLLWSTYLINKDAFSWMNIYILRK